MGRSPSHRRREFGFHAGDEAIFTPGSRRSGGFAISKPELMEKVSERLEDAAMRVLARGRFTEDG
jgi:hypothetical protein